MPASELDKRLNRLNAPHYQSVATTGIGVEETLKGITSLVIAHLVKKYGLEGSEPLDKEIQILNANTTIEVSTADSLWEEVDERRCPSAQSRGAGRRRESLSSSSTMPAGNEQAPLVATELIGSKPPGLSARGPFEDNYFSTSGAPAQIPQEMQVPTTSVEIALPKGIMDSLPQLDSRGAAGDGIGRSTAGGRTTSERWPRERGQHPAESLDERAARASPAAAQDHARREPAAVKSFRAPQSARNLGGGKVPPQIPRRLRGSE